MALAHPTSGGYGGEGGAVAAGVLFSTEDAKPGRRLSSFPRLKKKKIIFIKVTSEHPGISAFSFCKVAPRSLPRSLSHFES